MTTIRFTSEDLDLFSAASWDRNPLHLSEEYARRTPYGGRVVFGVLDGLTALGLLSDRPGYILSSIEMEFFDTALLGTEYVVSVRDDDDLQKTLLVKDGTRVVLEAELGFTIATAGTWKLEDWQSALSKPQDLEVADLNIGRRADGRYAPSAQAFDALCSRLALKSSLPRQHVAALLWASYLIGMEVPGKRALFSRLRIDFEPSAPVSAPFDYGVEIAERGSTGEFRLEGTLSSEGSTWATVELAAHVREDVPPITLASVEALVRRSQSLTGKVAFVTGGSRGLGSALVYALALHGCNVVLNFARSQQLAEGIRESASNAPGSVVLLSGDASDLTFCQKANAQIVEQFGGLDFLICNASPPLLPLWLEPSCATRINNFVQKSVALVTAPMMAFMPRLAERKGWNILISSIAASQPHPHFPHYSTAKCAAEALVRAAGTEYRSVSSLIVRPARLLTDLTNTPLGRRGAMRPEVVASAIVRRMNSDRCAGKVEILEQFGEKS